MNLMQMAGHLSVEFSATVEGPFTAGDLTTVVLWLPNRRGISLAHREGRDAAGTAELAVIRETIPVDGAEYEGTPWRFDYSTPITNDVVPGRDRLYARLAMVILRDLPKIDPRDQRPTGSRQWSAVHYGESRPACGADLRHDDKCTTDLKRVRCLDCLEEVNRAA